MKRLSFLSLLTILFVGMTFVSCSDDDDNDKKEPTVAEQYAGTYTAIDSINVAGSNDPTWAGKTANAVNYVITASSDSTIDVTIPAEEYDNIFAVGNVSMGSYTIKNIAWNADSLAFYKNYGKTATDEGLLLPHFNSTTMHINNQDFNFGPDSYIKVWKDANGKVNIINSFQPGRMPFPIYTIFSEGKK